MDKFRKAVFIVAYAKTSRGIEYLILKRKLHWKGLEFPKGGVENNESLKEAAIREIKEETGLKIKGKVKNFNVKGKYKYKKKFSDRSRIIGQTYVLFSAKVKKNKVVLDKHEHTTWKWLNFNDAIRKLTWANQKRALKIVNESLKQKEKL